MSSFGFWVWSLSLRVRFKVEALGVRVGFGV